MNYEKADKRLAVVTGGTRGIGAAVVRRFFRAGYDCIFTGTSRDRPSAAPQDGEYYYAEFEDREQVEQFAAYLDRRRPSVLVNNVGINIKGATIDYRLDDFDTVVAVNLRAPFVLTKAVLPGMKAAGWGRIVNISSIWSVTGNREDAAYCATKFGLDGMTAAVAAEVAHSGVLVNSVAPGFTYTEAAAAAYSTADLENISNMIPAGRLARPDDIASLVAWLASPENTYATGQNILVDGGLTRSAKP